MTQRDDAELGSMAKLHRAKTRPLGSSGRLFARLKRNPQLRDRDTLAHEPASSFCGERKHSALRIPANVAPRHEEREQCPADRTSEMRSALGPVVAHPCFGV